VFAKAVLSIPALMMVGRNTSDGRWLVAGDKEEHGKRTKSSALKQSQRLRLLIHRVSNLIKSIALIPVRLFRPVLAGVRRKQLVLASTDCISTYCTSTAFQGARPHKSVSTTRAAIL
jgi:hypothetical protein